MVRENGKDKVVVCCHGTIPLKTDSLNMKDNWSRVGFELNSIGTQIQLRLVVPNEGMENTG